MRTRLFLKTQMLVKSQNCDEALFSQFHESYRKVKNIRSKYNKLQNIMKAIRNRGLTSSPCFMLDRPHEQATKLIASVALRVKTISLLSAALTKFATFLLAPSYASVAFALLPLKQECQIRYNICAHAWVRKNSNNSKHKMNARTITK